MKKKFLFTLGNDFVMHNTGMFGATGNVLFDSIWSIANRSFGMYLISGADSRWRTRQAAASLFHFHRLVATSAISVGDYGVSKFINLVCPAFSCFRSDSSKARAFKRLMLTLKRNGGVYYDAYRFIAGLAPVSVQYGDILKSPPFNAIEKVKPPSKGYIESLFQKEIHMNLSDVFVSLVTHSAVSDGDVFTFSGRLHDGRAVSLSMITETRQRMRNYDIFPFRVIEKTMSVLPFISPEHAAVKALLDRLDFNLAKEQKARWQILEHFGVDPSSSIEKLFTDSRNIDLPVQVQAPIPHLCSAHIMVTDALALRKPRRSTASIISDLTKFTYKMSRNAGMIVPDLSLQNVRVSRSGRVSLARYATLIKINSRDVEATGKLLAGMVVENENEIIGGLEQLGVSYAKACQIAQTGSKKAVIRSVIENRPVFAIGVAEAATSLTGHINSLGRRYTRLIDQYSLMLSKYGFKL